jgi:hypothetical protein
MNDEFKRRVHLKEGGCTVKQRACYPLRQEMKIPQMVGVMGRFVPQPFIAQLNIPVPVPVRQHMSLYLGNVYPNGG